MQKQPFETGQKKLSLHLTKTILINIITCHCNIMDVDDLAPPTTPWGGPLGAKNWKNFDIVNN